MRATLAGVILAVIGSLGCSVHQPASAGADDRSRCPLGSPDEGQSCAVADGTRCVYGHDCTSTVVECRHGAWTTLETERGPLCPGVHPDAGRDAAADAPVDASLEAAVDAAGD